MSLPPGVGVNISLQVRVGGQWSNPLPLGYAAPTITAVSPQGGPTLGGSALTIAGANWGNDPSPSISVGGAPCPIVAGSYTPSPGAVVQAQCLLPRGQGTGLPTVVTVGGQPSQPGPQSVYAYAPPSIASVLPATGPTSGRETPAMVIDPVSGAVSFVPGPQAVVTVRRTAWGLWMQEAP